MGIQKFWKEPQTAPFWDTVLILTDSGCQNSCPFCGVTSDDKFYSTWESITADADHILQLGLKHINIGGSDAGQYERLVDVVRYLRENGANEVTLSSHGRPLKDPLFVKELKAAGLSYFGVSLYGSTATIHNMISQYGGSSEGSAFLDTTEAIKNCVEQGIGIVGNILATQYNKKDLNNIVQLYLDLTQNKILKLGITAPIIVTGHVKDLTRFKDWYLPMKDMGPYLRDVIFNHPSIPKPVLFGILNIPYCVVGVNTELIVYPNLDRNQQVNNLYEKNEIELPADVTPNVQFEECAHCSMRSKCGGLPLNEIKMFGAYGLKAIERIE